MATLRKMILGWFIRLENWHYKHCDPEIAEHYSSEINPKLLPVKGWIGVDFDGTLVTYNGWKGCEHHGEPIMSMVNRVKTWLDNEIEVRIFTARVGPVYPHQVTASRETIKQFCIRTFGKELPITHEKDQNMIVLCDDKAWNPNCSGCTSSDWNK